MNIWWNIVCLWIFLLNKIFKRIIVLLWKSFIYFSPEGCGISPTLGNLPIGFIFKVREKSNSMMLMLVREYIWLLALVMIQSMVKCMFRQISHRTWLVTDWEAMYVGISKSNVTDAVKSCIMPVKPRTFSHRNFSLIWIWWPNFTTMHIIVLEI